MALPEAVAAAAELGYIAELDREPVVVVEFAAGLIGAAPGKHPRLPEAAATEAAWHW